MTMIGPVTTTPHRVGVTGPIASGKSVVTACLRELGLIVIDHDVLARDALAPGSTGTAAVLEAFGPEVSHGDGTIDRAALGRIVFADDAARIRLEGIVHPWVKRRAAELESEAAQAGAGIVVHDIPLLIETGQAGDFDRLLVVDAPVELRVRRLVEGRGMDETQARRRIAAQTTTDHRRQVADILLDGSGTVANLDRQVRDEVRLWMRLWPGSLSPQAISSLAGDDFPVL
ncbi:MAG: dephospho-CoA kinase [Propionibacteriaceae bacterium]|jgi:dephospho-CoA kinase|nr:dephospho-CoA kinase [Propionibacteriaceae bacterium]